MMNIFKTRSIFSIYAVFLARLREFYRDKASFYWHLFLPLFIIFSFYFIFGKDNQPLYRVGVVGAVSESLKQKEKFFQLKYIQFIPQEKTTGLHKVRTHKLDMLIQVAEPLKYWVNSSNKKGYFLNQLMEHHYQGSVKKQATINRPIRYVDWVFPGIVALNIMFSCLWGVGWPIVKYRDEGYLKRLHASPLKVHQFILGQLLARLVIVSCVSVFIYIFGSLLIGLKTQGSYFDLLICYFMGVMSLASIGLLVATRTTSKEFADGLLNLFSWPMIIFSGMWFSLEGSDTWIQYLSYILPLTHLISSTRAIILEGATLIQVWPQVTVMTATTVVLLVTIFTLFKWNEK